MASLNSILHTVANVLPFRSEQELNDFRTDIDDVTLAVAVEVDDGDQDDAKSDATPAAKSSAAKK